VSRQSFDGAEKNPYVVLETIHASSGEPRCRSGLEYTRAARRTNSRCHASSQWIDIANPNQSKACMWILSFIDMSNEPATSKGLFIMVSATADLEVKARWSLFPSILLPHSCRQLLHVSGVSPAP
jgi:hypothetical protein